MAIADKNTVRKEVAKLQADFGQLCKDGKVTGEVKLLMSSMMMIIELILTIFLERSTKKDNKNSSIPSSQTDKDNTALGQSGQQGKGKPENGMLADNTRVHESVSVSSTPFCNICGEDLDAVSCTHHERRTKIDIVFEKVVQHVDAEVKKCPNCQSTNKGAFPVDMPGPLQYGDGLKAFVINLLMGQMVALNRVQKLVTSMIGTVISEATFLKYIWRLHQALEAWEAQAIKDLLIAPAINVDETSLKAGKDPHWIHVYSAGDITLKFLHRRRGKEAMEAINIIPRHGGVIIHDCWSSYLSYDHCKHGLCGSHILRELTFVVGSNNYAWACNMKRLLQKACKAVTESDEKQLDDKAYAGLQKNYRNILTRGAKELPPIPPKPSGKRGRIAKSDAHNLLERLQKHEASVLLFAKNPHVSFTNNRAERDLRMAKVKQKVSGCFRVVDYAKAYCRISSYLQTMASKGFNPLIAIQMALAGNIDGG